MARVWVQFLPVSARAASRSQLLLPALAASLLVIAGFAALVALSRPYVSSGPAAAEPYNLVVEGFRSGHVWLAKEAPPALATAPNPYAFATYRPYLQAPWGLTDLSYYHGHLYAYFGVTPAVVLFWPYRMLTGRSLHQAHAVLLFSVLGYALCLGLAVAAWRRFFPELRPWVGAAAALVLGSVTTLPVFLVRPGLYEVSISCGFAFTMLALVGLWNAWHRQTGRPAWLAVASLAYGLAVGARPSLLFGAVILLVLPAAAFWGSVRGGKPAPWFRDLLGALLPIAAVGAGLAAYNVWRFDNPLQFGHDYQLSGNDVFGTRSFAPVFFWDNVRLYFLEPLRWHGGFPFVWEPVSPPLAPGHLPIEFFFGTLTNLPILLAAALVPLAWAGRQAEKGLPAAVSMLAVLFLTGAVPICFYAGATSRYLLDFLPALALLAVLGFLGVERASCGGPSPAAVRTLSFGPLLRGAVLGALAYSVIVVWLLAVALSGFYRGAESGVAELGEGKIDAAAVSYANVGRIDPDFRPQADMALGTALMAKGRMAEAIAHLGSAVAEKPDFQAAHYNLGLAYLAVGRFLDAAESFRRAAALDPSDADAEAAEGAALFRAGRILEAVAHEEAALRIQPGLGNARANLETFEKDLGTSAKRQRVSGSQ